MENYTLEQVKGFAEANHPKAVEVKASSLCPLEAVIVQIEEDKHYESIYYWITGSWFRYINCETVGEGKFKI